jgi:23S rRNA (cytidine1920-2'-O)/16S rRNA (cytidine1409-2'-O)-methyltransferase
MNRKTTPLRRRLDSELVRRGLADTRTSAHAAIVSGRVVVSGRPTAKPATLVAPDEPIELATAESDWASRGGIKLAAALDEFGVLPEGLNALDVGASTGGFTDVLVSRGAARVVALDVGYGQLLWRLRTHPAVVVVDRTNFRTADPSSLGGPFDLVVMDVSFIGAGVLAPMLARAGRPGTDYVVLVKPQFEVGPKRVGRGGIVRDPAAHRDAVRSVAIALSAAGIGVLQAAPSPIAGAKGNREFLVHGRLGAPGLDPDQILALAVP